MNSLDELWSRLSRVETLRFESQSRTGSGWGGVGEGRVEVNATQDNVLIWKERGQWQQDGGREIRFFNTFRWTKREGTLQLEHLSAIVIFGARTFRPLPLSMKTTATPPTPYPADFSLPTKSANSAPSFFLGHCPLIRQSAQRPCCFHAGGKSLVARPAPNLFERPPQPTDNGSLFPLKTRKRLNKH